MTVTYCTTKEVFEFLGGMKKIPRVNSASPEEVGTGDNTVTIFWLNYRQVIASTYTLYHAATWSNAATELIEVTDYTIDKDEGKITLTDAGKTKVGTDKIWARYWFGFTTDSNMEDNINRNEDKIDSDTGHAWRTKTVTNEFHNIDSPYVTFRGIRISLNHRSIKTLDGNEGDKIEIWNGNDYDDYVATKTEGRANDFWIESGIGNVYLITFPTTRPLGLRATYRYGEDTVAGDIKKACILLSAADFISGSNELTDSLPDGFNIIPSEVKAERWNKTAEGIIADNYEFFVNSY